MPKKLIDLEVEEISAVDKAANLRQFLVIKQDTDFFPHESTNPNFKPGTEIGTRNAAAEAAEKAWVEYIDAAMKKLQLQNAGYEPREAVISRLMLTDATARRLAQAWQDAMNNPASAEAEKRARELVQKDGNLTYEQAYDKVLLANKDLYELISEEERAAQEKRPVRKVGAKSLRDAIGDLMDKVVAEEKAANPKVTYYDALSGGLKKRGLMPLYQMYAEIDAIMPIPDAAQRLAKRYGMEPAEIIKKVQ